MFRVVAIALAVATASAADDVCAFPGDPSCSLTEDADTVLSLLQTKAIRTKTKIGSPDNPDYAPTDDLISATCLKQCAGTVCMDPSVGSHQMLSCMQTCEMRVRGQTQATCESQCHRNGQSGCTLTAAGFTANMCWDCSDWASASEAAKNAFLTNQDCMAGCAVVTPCEEQCAGTVCMDPSVGINQMLSCMQSCEMRMFGEDPVACESTCDRNGQSGCSLTVDGFTANMCGYCSDWAHASAALHTSFLNNDDCKKGCNVGKLSICQKQCYGTVCPDPSIGSNQQLSCAQACEFRLAGEGAAECGYRCNRNGQSGCSLTVSGYTANMCGWCPDWPYADQADHTSFLNNQDCVLGCSVELPTNSTEPM